MSVGGVDTRERLCLLLEGDIEEDADAELVSFGIGWLSDFPTRAGNDTMS